MDYYNLKLIAKELLQESNRLNTLSRVYWYSPTSRKLKLGSKIGYYETEPTGINFTHGSKLILVFQRVAFSSLATIINKYLPGNESIEYREDYRSKVDTGFDVYQRVEQLKLFIEPDQKESKSYNIAQMLKQGIYWRERQLFALQEVDPPLSAHEISQIMSDVSARLKQAMAYLKAQSNPQAELRIRRMSGVRHRMVRVDAVDDQSEKAGFSNLVIVFSASSKYLPEVVLPKEPNPKRKPRSDSKAAQYAADPSSFKYYDKFGIFEVYDEL